MHVYYFIDINKTFQDPLFIFLSFSVVFRVLFVFTLFLECL